MTASVRPFMAARTSSSEMDGSSASGAAAPAGGDLGS